MARFEFDSRFFCLLATSLTILFPRDVLSGDSRVLLAASGVSGQGSAVAEKGMPVAGGRPVGMRRVGSAVSGAVPYRQPPRLANQDPVTKFAKLAGDDWTAEEPSCVRKSPDSRMAAVGGYIRSTSLGFDKAKRKYASALHVVDLKSRREVAAFPISESDYRYQKGGSKITDCIFVQSWRYVAAVSQSHVALFDVQRRAELGKDYFGEPFNDPSLSHLKAAEKDYLMVREGRRTVYYQIVRKR